MFRLRFAINWFHFQIFSDIKVLERKSKVKILTRIEGDNIKFFGIGSHEARDHSESLHEGKR